MMRFSLMLRNFSVETISVIASRSGLKYGSTFSDKSPGKKPNDSPASTAGRESTMRVTSLFFNAASARATAR